MSRIETIVEDLKVLPPAGLEQVAELIRRLKTKAVEDRRAALASTAGSLTAEEADALERAINQDCERIDGRDW
jgi:hypothetical protein